MKIHEYISRGNERRITQIYAKQDKILCNCFKKQFNSFFILKKKKQKLFKKTKKNSLKILAIIKI